METEGKATVLSPGTLRQESHPFSLPGLPFANTSGHLVITLYLQTFLTHSVFRNQLTLCMHAKSLQLCLTLCNPMDCSPPGSSVHGILQARILECVAMPFSRGSSLTRGQTHVSCFAGRFFTNEPSGKPFYDQYCVLKVGITHCLEKTPKSWSPLHEGREGLKGGPDSARCLGFW